jgi:lysophospholipase L1-like esterase
MLVLIVQTSLNSTRVVRVACAGDSITEISGYPGYLQTLLGANYEVGNFGVCGATVRTDSYTPYVEEEAFTQVAEFQPDIIVLILGTNDARTDNYDSIDSFVDNYKNLINQLQALDSKPKVFIAKPPPMFQNYLELNPTDYDEGVIPKIKQVAKELNLPLVDLYSVLENRPDCFEDGVHPNSKGATIIAETVYEFLSSQTS